MVKFKKRIAACVLAAAVALAALTACNASVPAAKQTIAPLAAPTAQVERAGSRAVKYFTRNDFSKATVNCDMSSTDDAAVKNVVLAINSSIPALYMSNLTDGTATIVTNEMMYVVNTKNDDWYTMGVEGNKAQATADSIVLSDAVAQAGCGTAAINGVNYYFESVSTTDDEGETTTTYYCFDEADTEGQNLRYLVLENQTSRQLYKINSVSTHVDDTLFNIPEERKIESGKFGVKGHWKM